MGKEDVINRILSDAEAEAADIISAAKKQADEAEAAALSEAAAEEERARAEAAARAKRITDGKAAAARLEASKIMLAEKRRVVEEVYARALKKLKELPKSESVAQIEKLLLSHAETGDEVLLAKDFGYAREVCALPVFKDKKLKLCKTRAQISGGVILRGSSCDKDLSFEALLSEDMDKNVAAMAARLFANARTE